VERLGSTRFDAVALVQCSSPFTLAEDVDGTIEVLERTGAGSAFSVTRLDHAYHPEKVRVLEGERLRPYEGDLEPRAKHEVGDLWINNGSVYVSRRETLEAGSLASHDLCGYVMPEERSLDVNAPLDLEFARFLSSRRADG
jgi:CMP-N,N'-diacetyllegionaminic acid synthase